MDKNVSALHNGMLFCT